MTPPDSFEAQLERAIAELERDPGFDLEGFLRSYPAEAAALRDRIARLRELGMLGHALGSGGRSQRVASHPEEAKGTRIGGYEILGTIGSGGMGIVYRGLDAELGREIALKVLSFDGGPVRSEEARRSASERFVAEARVTARLDHPNIVPVHEVGTTEDGRVYFTMKLVEGLTLREVIDRLAEGDAETERSFPLARQVEIVRSLCGAVSYAHARGIVHRDLKPENVMVGGFGEVYVMDWGIARVRELGLADARGDGNAARDVHERRTASGDVFGTPSFMAPEQARGDVEQVGERTDVFGLGAILYYLLSGQPPYWGSSPAAVLARSREGRLNDPGMQRVARKVPSELRAVCLRALAARPVDRYPSARALADDLEAFLADRQGSAWRDPIPVQVAKTVRRNPVRSATVAALALLFPLALFGWRERGLRELEVQKRIDGEFRLALTEVRERCYEVSAFGEIEIDVGGSFEYGAASVGASGSLDHAGSAEDYLTTFSACGVPLNDGRPVSDIAARLGTVRDRDPQLHEIFVESLYEVALRLCSARIAHARWLEDGHAVPLLGIDERELAREAGSRHPDLRAFWPRLEEVVRACEEDPWRRTVWQAWLDAMRDDATPRAFERFLVDEDPAALNGRNLILLASLTQVAFGDERAEPLYRLAQRAEPSHLAPYFALGQFEYERQRFDRALQHYQVARALRPSSTHVLNGMCAVYVALGNTADAIDFGREAVQLAPSSSSSYYTLGVAYLDARELQLAIAAQRRATELEPEYANAWVALGQSYFAVARGDPMPWSDESVPGVEPAGVRAEGSESQPGPGDGFEDVGGTPFATAWLNRAVEAYDEALRCEPDSVAALTCRGQVHLMRAEFAQALNLYERATRVDPSQPAGWAGAQIALQRLFLTERQYVFEQAAREHGTGHGGDALQSLGQEIELLRGVRRPLDLRPLNWLATARLHRGEVVESANLFRPVVDGLVQADDPEHLAEEAFGIPAVLPVWRACVAAARAAVGEGCEVLEGHVLLEPRDPDLFDEAGVALPRIAPADRPSLDGYPSAHPVEVEELRDFASQCLELWLGWERADAASAAPRVSGAQRLVGLREVDGERALREISDQPDIASSLEEIRNWIGELEATQAH